MLGWGAASGIQGPVQPAAFSTPTDIRLGEGVAELGGLHVILTEHHESPRIDRQLYGRCARQHDRGSCEAIVALDDEIYRVCAPTLARLLARLHARRTDTGVPAWTYRALTWLAQRAAEARSRRVREQTMEKRQAAAPRAGLLGESGMTASRRVLAVGMASATLQAWGAARGGRYECVIEPNQTVELRSPIDGLIDKVLVKRGDRVKTGQALVVLESSVETSALKEARFRAQMEGRIAVTRNRLDYAVRKLDRATELSAQNYVAAQSRDEAEAEKRVAEAELRDASDSQLLAQRELQYSSDLLARRTLRSPFNGVVVERMLNPGDLAESGTGRRPVLKLAQVEPLRVEVVLPIAAYGTLRPGAVAMVAPEALGGRYPATVTVVDSVFDSASGTFGARLEMANAQGKLPAGIRCQVDFSQLAAPPVPRGDDGAVEPRR